MKSPEEITPIDTFNDPLLSEEEKEILLGYHLYYKFKNMTKKYKLIKEYPGSPKLGYISKSHVDAPDNAHYWDHIWFNPEDYPEFWEEVKKPLFTTEDGVDVFEGDTVFLVKKYKDPVKISIVTISPWRKGYGDKGKPVDSDLAFYSERAAQKFVEENKPKYSEKDMLKMYKAGNCSMYIFESELAQINKEKFGNNK